MTSTYTVAIDGVISAPVSSGLLEVMDDPLLAEEITLEAIKISVSDKLGGFDGFSLARCDGHSSHGAAARKAPTHRAQVDFNALANCVGAVTRRYETIRDALAATQEAVEVCMQSVETASHDELRAMLIALMNTTRVAVEECASDVDPPPLTPACDADSTGSTNATSSSSSSAGDDAYSRERALMGYQRLIDDDGAAMDEDGGECEDGEVDDSPPLE